MGKTATGMEMWIVEYKIKNARNGWYPAGSLMFYSQERAEMEAQEKGEMDGAAEYRAAKYTREEVRQ